MEILKSKKSNHVSSSSRSSIISFQAPFTDDPAHLPTSTQGVNPRSLSSSQIRYSSSNLPVIIKNPTSELNWTLNQPLDASSSTKSLSNDLSASSSCKATPGVNLPSLSSSLFKKSNLISETIGKALGLLASPEVIESNEDHFYNLSQPLLCSDSLKKLSKIQSESSYQISSESINHYMASTTITSDPVTSPMISQSSNTKPQPSTSLQSIVSQSTTSKSKAESKPSCPVCSLSFEVIKSPDFYSHLIGCFKLFA